MKRPVDETTRVTRPAHAHRTAQDQAAFFLPHLRPGMALLDLGCGPGTITVGLAAAVAPGPAVGIDLRPERPDGAVTTLELIAGDVLNLPFPDASFDAIFASALLQHLPDPVSALREARRVARPGAVIGVVDADWDGELRYPADPLLDRSVDLARRLRARNSPTVGKQLRALLVAAGFVDCVGSARAVTYGTPDETAEIGDQQASLFTHPVFVRLLTDHDGSTDAELAAIAQAWRDWGRLPGAFLARFWCEAIGWAPT